MDTNEREELEALRQLRAVVATCLVMKEWYDYGLGKTVELEHISYDDWEQIQDLVNKRC